MFQAIQIETQSEQQGMGFGGRQQTGRGVPPVFFVSAESKGL